MAAIRMLFLMTVLLLSCMILPAISKAYQQREMEEDGFLMGADNADSYDYGSGPALLRVVRAAAEPKRRKHVVNARRFGFRG